MSCLRSFAPRILLTLGLVLALPSPAHADPRAFTARTPTPLNVNGDIVLAGNTLVTCPAADADCANAHAGTGARINNNDFAMQALDSDSDPATFDSSSATLNLPPGSTVRFAGLYWGAETTTDPSLRDSAKLKLPGESQYRTVRATTIDTIGTWYQAFADVTELAREEGVYTVADVQATAGANHAAGWTLVVAYSNPQEPLRNLVVYDGLQSVETTDVVIAPTGFLAPPASHGPVRSRVGYVGYEGDLGYTGDEVTLNGHSLGAGNAFRGSVTRDGAAVPGADPDYANTLGYDAHVEQTTGVLTPGDRSAEIRLSTNGDVYLPGVVTFSTDIIAPSFGASLKVALTDTSGAPTNPGDELALEASSSNTGDDSALSVAIELPIPAGTTLVPGGIEWFVAGEWVPAPGTTVSGATVHVPIGDLAPGAGFHVRIRVTVDTALAPGSAIDGRARVTYVGGLIGDARNDDGTARSLVSAPAVAPPPPTPPVLNPTAATDVSIGLTATASSVAPGSPLTYTLDIRNVGGTDATGIKVKDLFPAVSPIRAIRAPGWNCSRIDQSVLCRRTKLAAGERAPIEIDVLTPLVATTLSDSATASSTTADVNPKNNSETANVSITGALWSLGGVTLGVPDVGIRIRQAIHDAHAGRALALRIRVSNSGPTVAHGVRVTLAGLKGAHCRCRVGDVPAGTTVTVTARFTPLVVGRTRFHASVAMRETDPQLADNATAVRIIVQ